MRTFWTVLVTSLFIGLLYVVFWWPFWRGPDAGWHSLDTVVLSTSLLFNLFFQVLLNWLVPIPPRK